MKLWPRVWCLVFLTHGVYCKFSNVVLKTKNALRISGAASLCLATDKCCLCGQVRGPRDPGSGQCLGRSRGRRTEVAVDGTRVHTADVVRTAAVCRASRVPRPGEHGVNNETLFSATQSACNRWQHGLSVQGR